MKLADHIKAKEILGLNDAGIVSAGLRGGLIDVMGSKTAATIAFVFDDGYRSVYTNAFPLFRQYGYTATLAQEIDKIGRDYGADPNYPVCTTEDLRELIRAGWEVCNHPALDLEATEAEMVSAAQAENTLLKQLLTGEKVKNYSTGAITDGSLAYPEFSAFRVTSAVYRGGARNATSDRAYRFVFDKLRTINGDIATRGDGLYVFAKGDEHAMLMSAFPVDVTSTSVDKSLAFLDGLAQAGSQAILYAHDVPDETPSWGSPSPYLLTSDLEAILKRCKDLGIAVVPLARLYKGNAIGDSTFEDSTGTFVATGGSDAAEFSETDTLNGATRCVVLTAASAHSNDNNVAYTTDNFVVEPFCRYRVRIRYKIDTALTLTGGTGNRNHGLNILLETTQANTSGAPTAYHTARAAVLNDTVSRIPYDATDGYDEYSVILVTGAGSRGRIRVALFNAAGTARIGQIVAEKLDSVVTRPLSGTRTFNATLSRTIYLPTPENFSDNRDWDWEVSVSAAPVVASTTYSHAREDSADLTPTEGMTCYVLGAGAGDFAGQGGKLATYSGSSWAFSSLSNGAFFRTTNFDGITSPAIWVRHRGIRSDGTALYEVHYSSAANAQAIVEPGRNTAKIYESSGLRSDTFTWVARPRAVAQ